MRCARTGDVGLSTFYRSLTKSGVVAEMVVPLSWLRVLWYGTEEFVFLCVCVCVCVCVCNAYCSRSV